MECWGDEIFGSGEGRFVGCDGSAGRDSITVLRCCPKFFRKGVAETRGVVVTSVARGFQRRFSGRGFGLHTVAESSACFLQDRTISCFAVLYFAFLGLGSSGGRRLLNSDTEEMTECFSNEDQFSQVRFWNQRFVPRQKRKERKSFVVMRKRSDENSCHDSR